MEEACFLELLVSKRRRLENEHSESWQCLRVNLGISQNCSWIIEIRKECYYARFVCCTGIEWIKIKLKVQIFVVC